MKGECSKVELYPNLAEGMRPAQRPDFFRDRKER